jgi:hypothetical protein
MKEGFAYLKGRRVLQSTFLIDLIAMVFGMPLRCSRSSRRRSSTPGRR